MDIIEWYNDLTDRATTRSAGERIGVSHTTLGRQMRNGELSAEIVIGLCRAYGRSPITGLIETGFVFDHETEGVGVDYALDKATNKQLLDAILRRSDPEAHELFGAASNPQVVDIVEDVPSGLYAVADSSDEEEEGDPGDYND